jgi:CMP-N-acetylneuraminic acid synthetase
MFAKNEDIFIIIPARRGSKRLKNKNTMVFDGFPLFEWTIVAAIYMKNILCSLGIENAEIICTTNEKKILMEIEKKYSGFVSTVKRDEKLAGDNITLEAVIIDATEQILKNNSKNNKQQKDSRYILMQPTSPIRLKIDLFNFCKKFIEVKDDFSLVSVNEKYLEDKDIYPLEEIVKDNKNIKWVIGEKRFKKKNQRERSAFVDGSLYSGSIPLLSENSFMPAEKTLVFFQSIPRSIDIDTEKDFNKAIETISNFRKEGLSFVQPKI